MANPIIASIGRHFGFLTREYGMKPYKLLADSWDRKWTPSVAYAGGQSGVLVQYDVREAYVDVLIFALADYQFPMRGNGVAVTEGLPLNGVIYLSDSSALIQPLRAPHKTATDEPDEVFDGYIAQAATKLQYYAKDLLIGDFRRAPEVRTAIAEIMSKR